MKNVILFMFSFLLLLSSCNKDKVETCEDCNFTCLDGVEPDVYTNECRTGWTCSFKVFEQSKISTDEAQGVVSGDKTVFQMIRSTDGSPDIEDDEFTEILVFQLDSSQESFSEEASELTLRVHFKQVCFCPSVVFNPIFDGCLQGEKQADGTWFVQVFIDGQIEFGVEAQFSN